MSSKPRTSPSLHDIGENELVRRVAKWMEAAPAPVTCPRAGRARATFSPPSWAKARVLVPIGDDAAILRSPGGSALLAVTTDMLVEGTHFAPDQPPETVGAKCANANLSDLAAVGAWPAWVLVSLGAPAATPVSWIEGFYRGLRSVLDPYRCPCVGGDSVRSSRLTINIALGGYCDPEVSLPLRSRAKPGQSLYVTGTLGDSGAGLFLLQKPSARRKRPIRPSDAAALIERHRCGAARVANGMAIARHCSDAAMMDLSDGLAVDLPRLAEASACGFEVRLAALPYSASLRRLAAAVSLPARHFALFGGEDYELLFTTALDPALWRRKAAAAASGRPIRITRIGRVVEKPGVSFLDARGRPLDLRDAAFRHF